ncbi:uncharacterized protein LOC113642587 [Tachysurus fulvidraco]|uniref:uncharacterized protein LOC113642587 n=1 Tax=Tachysurus fulvidraco TaxID=1234273 RepID=UPI001FED2EA5|nr:uncharacterized protein LOC113642587 [Tachysurus fulvidraco]
MLVSSLTHCLSVLIFQLWRVQTFSPISACPDSCVCEDTFLVNCASQGLPTAPSRIPATATALDLSHNALHSLSPLGSGHMHLQGLQHLRVGNNSLESLSMCSGIQGIAGTRTLTRRKQRCLSWAPDLQSLSADRNQLKCLPRGLGNIKSLKVLQLSHNRISEIGRADLAGCTHLNELHLQHNLINTIHPEAFKDLQELKVLDVSYNLLATIPVPAYLSLRNLNVLVDIFGNRWRCDCNLKTIRRWLSFDSELGKPAWEVVCFSPSHHAGKSLLYVEESDLACLQPVYSTPGLNKEVTVEEGMEFILSCSAANQDFMHTSWWTPQGQISDGQSFLHISNAKERDAGLYVCVSGYQEEHVSVFSLHVRKRAHDKRLRREAQIGSVELNSEDKDNIQRNAPSIRAVQQSHFALAVSLSVIITFIVAFVLGVVLRPFLDKCYKQIQNKRSSTQSPQNSQTSSTSQRPYVNEGYSDTDDQEQELHEGPRVTFGGVTEIHDKGGVPYYVTAEGGRSGSNTDVAVLHKNTDRVLVEDIELHKDVPLREENTEMTSPISTESLNAESSKGIEFEYIPDPEDTIELEDKSISSASSLSGEQQESQMPYEAKESIEQSVDSPTVSKYEDDDEQASTGQRTTIPGFVSDPFPLNMSESKEESVDELDPDLWNDSGESFSFTEGSPRSSSRVSHVDAFGHPNIQKEMSVDEPRDRSSSWNSSKSEESEGKDTEYTADPEDDEDLETQISYSENDDVNYDENKLSVLEEDIHNENKKPGTGAQLRQDTITLDPTDIYLTYTRGDSFDDEQFTDYKKRHPSSNSDYEDEPTQYHVHPVYRSSHQTTTPMEDGSGTSRCIEENEDEQGEYPRNLQIRLGDKVPTIPAIPVISRDSLSDESHVSSYFDDSIFGKIDQALDPIPEVKRYLHFSQSQSFPSIQTPPCSTEEEEEIIPTEVEKTESKKFYSEDNFFAQSDASLDDLPKVKHYVQFSPSEPQISSDSAVDQVATPVLVSKTESPSDTISISYEGQSVSLEAMPKTQRYVQFRQSEPQTVPEPNIPAIKEGSYDSAPTASLKQVATPVLGSKRESPSDTISISYEGQSVSLEAMPKVQRYVQFRQSEPQTVHEPNITNIKEGSYDSTPTASVSQVATPVLVSKTKSPSDTISISYEGQSVSLETMPKTQRYVQFIKSEPQTVPEPNIPAIKEGSYDSAPTASLKQVATSVLGSKRESPSDTISISYEGQSVSLETMPKTQRYVQFRQSEPQTVNEPNITNIHRGGFFGQIPISFDEVPKVKRRILFSQLESHHQPSSEYRPSKKRYPLSEEQNTHEIKTTLVTTKPHGPGDFFVRIGAFLDGMPKVKRYMQFTQSEVFKTYNLPYFPLNVAVPTLPAGTEVKKNNSPFEDGDPVVDEDSFFGQIGVFFDGIPKVRRRIQFTERLSQPPESQSPSNYIQPAAAEHSFFVPIGASSEIPNVRRYIQFSQSSSQPSSQYSDRQTARPVLTKPELISSSSSLDDSKTNTEDTFFKKMEVSELPKLNRYIQFTKQRSKSSRSSNAFGVTDHVVKKTDLRGLELSRVDVKPFLTEDNFFAHIGTNLNSPPRVNRYIQFTRSEPYSSQQSTEKMTEKERKTSSSSVDDDDALFDGIFESLNKIPKVKKSLLFTQSTYQNSDLTEVSQKVTPQLVTKTESVRPDPTSLPDKEVLSIKQDNFLGQLGDTTLYEVPKVKKYITFSQSKAYPATLSSKNINDQSDIPFFNTETVTPVSVTKTECSSIDSSFDEKQRTVIKEDTGFSGQTGMPFDEVPKVKRYVQFARTEPRPSAQSLSTKLQTRGSEDKVSPAIKGDDFFCQTGSSFDELPRVKRHIRFERAEPRLRPPMLHSLSNRTEKSIQTSTELKMKDLASEDYVAPAAGEHDFFGPIGTSYEIPKLQRYIRFSQNSTQPSSQHLNRQTGRPVLTKPELRTSLDDSKSNDEDTFFRKKDVSELPKVNRYVQFTQQHSTPRKSLNTHGVTDEKTGLWGSDLSRVDITPPVTEDSFLGHLGTNLNSLPRVNRFIQFTQSEPFPSSQSQSSTEKMAKNAPIFTQPEYHNKTAANDKSSNTADSGFGSLDLSFIQLPKEKRHVYNVQSEAKKNDYFGQTDGVPRLIRYRQFRQSESLTQTSSPSISPQKWETMDVESTDSKMFKTNLTSGTARDLSQIQDAPSGMKVSTETGRLHQLPEPKRSIPDVYGQPDRVFIEEEEEVFRHTSSNSLSDDTKYVNTHGSSGRTALSTTESRTILESKLSGLHASSNESAGLPTRKLVIDPALQGVFQSIPDEPGASPGKDDAREYLRDSSLARQRQERRRLLFQQKRRAMDGFSLSSESFNSQESD